MIVALIGIGGTILGVILGALLNHFLEKNRANSSLILNKKIEIYSNILVKLNTLFQDEEKNFTSDPKFIENIRVTLAKSLSTGRLLAGEELENKLRDYYEAAIDFWEKGGDDGTMRRFSMEVEQLMREELGQKNLLKANPFKKQQI